METQQITMDEVRHEMLKLDGHELVVVRQLKTHAPKSVEIVSDSIHYQLNAMMGTQQIMMDVAQHEMLKLDGLELVVVRQLKIHAPRSVAIAKE